jgi:hypothetical protein
MLSHQSHQLHTAVHSQQQVQPATKDSKGETIVLECLNSKIFVLNNEGICTCIIKFGGRTEFVPDFSTYKGK